MPSFSGKALTCGFYSLFPVNYLLVESLDSLFVHYGQSIQLEYPAASGKVCDLSGVSSDICQRLINLFLPDSDGRRPCHGKF